MIRKRVPVDLQAALGKKVIKRSLKTSDPKQAKLLKPLIEAEIQNLFETTRRELASTNKKKSTYPGDLSIHDPTPLVSEEDRKHMCNLSNQLNIGLFENRLSEEHITLTQNDIMGRHIYSPQKRTLLVQLLEIPKAAFQGKGYDKQKFMRMWDVAYHSPDKFSSNLSNTHAEPITSTVESNATPKGVGVTLMGIYEKWSDAKIRSEKNKENAKVSSARMKQKLLAFTESQGDIAIGEITADHVITLRDHLTATTKHKNKTIKGYLTTIQTMVSFAFNERYIKTNPLSGAKYYPQENDSDTRLPFDKEDLVKLFLNPKFKALKEKEPTKFWISLIALFAGARIEEIALLKKEDIKESDGVHYLDINDLTDDKKVKTKSSIRKVPIHTQLIELGFLKYVAQAAPNEFIFPNLKSIENRRGHSISKWFSTYKKSVGITDKAKVFHSFRHTHVGTSRDVGIEVDARKQIVGHSDNSAHSGYGNGYSLKTLHSELCKLNFGIDFKQLVDA
jgi:integrase